jgi:serine/threonine protein kinase/TolB-like protein
MSLETGMRLGAYEIIAPLGEGGMGTVYRALDTKLGRDVAIKVLHPEASGDHKSRTRFSREARALASLNVSGVAAVYGLEEDNGVQFLVMELVPGPTLDDRLHHGGPLSLPDALAVGLHIAEALEAAHDKGIIHRDLKPANVKLTPDGRTKLLDFGLAKSLHDEEGPGDGRTRTNLTRTGTILGTPAYMSPEQAGGAAVDKRADIWAFGCVLFEVLSGRRVFGGQTAQSIFVAIWECEPDWGALPAATPEEVRRLLQRCLCKDVNRRLRDIGEARITLEEATRPYTGRPPMGRQPADTERLPVSRVREVFPVPADPASALSETRRHPGTTPDLPVSPVLVVATARPPLVVEAPPPPAPAAPRGRFAYLAVFLVVAALAAVAAYFLLFHARPVRSLAVLPVEAPAGDPELRGLADSLTSAIVADAALSGRLKQVPLDEVAQASAAGSPAEAGRRLGVNAVLTGRLVRQGDRIILHVELTDVQTSGLMWHDDDFQALAGHNGLIVADWAPAVASRVRQILDAN